MLSTGTGVNCATVHHVALALVLVLFGCDQGPVLTVEMPLHLEEHLDAANIVGSEVPADITQPVTWHFDEPQPDWRAVKTISGPREAARAVRVDDALRLSLTGVNRHTSNRRLIGAIYVDLPGWSLEDWAYVEVRCRTSNPMLGVGLGFNYTDEDPLYEGWFPFYSVGQRVPFVTDGTVQTYRLPLDWSEMRSWEGPWTHLGITFNSRPDEEAVALDILSISVVPVEALYACAPSGAPQPMTWQFNEPQPDWIAPPHFNPTIPALLLEQTDDALRVTFDERHDDPRPSPLLHGDIYVDLPDLRLEDWGHVLIRARASEGIRSINLCFNFNDPAMADDLSLGMAQGCGEQIPIIDDGTVQTYRLPTEWNERLDGEWEGPWRQLVHTINAEKPSSLEILSISLAPKEADYTEDRVGVRIEQRGSSSDTPGEAPFQRSLYMRTPGKISFPVRVPQSGRLDVGLGVLKRDNPVTSTITVTTEDGLVESLLEETHSDPKYWGQRSLDMSHLEGQTVTLEMGAEAAQNGAVTFWSLPTISGTRSTEKPNVLFYIIDGGGADYMSVYGYNRRTTPNLERIAAEGAVFNRAYSNSTWTRPSTASFLTSLQHSVLGGLRNGRNPVPEQAMTMAEHMNRAGYQTAEFTSNPNAGRVSSLERGNDLIRDFGIVPNSVSSVALQEDFWDWRTAYPGEPYWVHFQTTDVHSDHTPVPPFAGLFINSEDRRRSEEWWEGLGPVKMRQGDVGFLEAFMALDIDHVPLLTAARDLHDETMAHQDHQIGQLVARLKAEGEWERTLLIIASDHSVAAGAWDYSLLMEDPLPTTHIAYDDPTIPMFRTGVSHIPMIVVWPGHIKGGQRLSQPVSMIDMLPSILDLLDLPMPEVMQGQSLAPLLLGEPGWEPRPVILDEFRVDAATGEFRGKIEVIDGRWGASLQINPDPEDPPEWQRPGPLLLFDLWNDPYCLQSLHEERPELVEKYTAFLESQWEAHQNLGSFFTPAEAAALTPAQLETLRALGYIR